MRIIAVDPGYDRLGVAVLERDYNPTSRTNEQWIYSETFKTSPKDEINSRLFQVGDRIRALCDEYQPDYLVIEKLFFNNNQKTVMHVSEVRGIIMYAAHQVGIQVVEFTPLQIKAAVAGHGHADKQSVIDMTTQLLSIPAGMRLDDEYDAIACGLTFFAHYRPDSANED